MFAICPTANVGRPSQPESSSAFSQRKRFVAITAGAQSSVRPRSRARSIVARASATVPASGFSEKTCFPACERGHIDLMVERRRGEIQHRRHALIGQESIEGRCDGRARQSQRRQILRQALGACRVRVVDRNGRGATRQRRETRRVRPQGDVATADDSQSDPAISHVFPPLPPSRCPGTIAWWEGAVG